MLGADTTSGTAGRRNSACFSSPASPYGPTDDTRCWSVSGWYEEYYPHGSTAWWAQDSAAGVSLKRYRYTGMERDEETGLQAHGVRMYAPWLGRWSSADSSGLKEGINRYSYARNSPMNRVDTNGRADNYFLSRASAYLGGIVERSPTLQATKDLVNAGLSVAWDEPELAVKQMNSAFGHLVQELPGAGLVSTVAARHENQQQVQASFESGNVIAAVQQSAQFEYNQSNLALAVDTITAIPQSLGNGYTFLTGTEAEARAATTAQMDLVEGQVGLAVAVVGALEGAGFGRAGAAKPPPTGNGGTGASFGRAESLDSIPGAASRAAGATVPPVSTAAATAARLTALLPARASRAAHPPAPQAGGTRRARRAESTARPASNSDPSAPAPSNYLHRR